MQLGNENGKEWSMNTESANHVKASILEELQQLSIRKATLQGVLDLLNGPAEKKYLDESAILAALGKGVEPPPAVIDAPRGKAGYKQPNRGMQASLLRQLSLGAARFDDLRNRVTHNHDGREAFAKVLTHACKRNLVAMRGEMISLTPNGAKMAQWFVAHPNAKMYNNEPLA